MEITSETFVQRIAYSYIRFSSSAQSEGDSFRRQIEKTVKFCDDNNLHLSETRYEDLGVSGFTGENMETGALASFIEAVEVGKIKKGSVLILENWDRFSRLEALKAYNKLGEILELGVDVVTLSDGKFHTAADHGKFLPLITSLVEMERAHSESARKKDLIQNALTKKRRLAMAGKGILTTRCPAWMRYNADKKGFELVPERAQVVQRIIRLTQEGKGKREIANMLNTEKVPTLGCWDHSATEWHESNILALTKSRSLMGEVQLDQKKRDENVKTIPGYYPALVDEKTWQSIQPAKREFTAGPQSNVMNLFSGLLHDGYRPDYRMKVFTVVGKARTYFYLQSDYRRVDPACAEFNRSKKGKAKEGKSKKVKSGKAKEGKQKPLSCETLDYQEFEQHVLRHFEEFEFSEVVPQATPEESLRVELLKAEKRKTEKAVENLLDMVQKGNGGDSVLVMGRIGTICIGGQPKSGFLKLCRRKVKSAEVRKKVDMKTTTVENRVALLLMAQRVKNQGHQSIAALAATLADETKPFGLAELEDLAEQTIAVDDAILTCLLLEFCVDNSFDVVKLNRKSVFHKKLAAGIKSIFGLA